MIMALGVFSMDGFDDPFKVFHAALLCLCSIYVSELFLITRDAHDFMKYWSFESL